MTRVTIAEIKGAYEQTGSVWKAGKLLGISGQTVSERLRRAGVACLVPQWTDEEREELRRRYEAGERLAKIGEALNRTYAAVATQANELGISGSNQPRGPKRVKPPSKYSKTATADHWDTYLVSGQSIRQYTAANGLNITSFINSVKAHLPGHWEDHMEDLGKPLIKCEYCGEDTYQMTAKQRFCSAKCSATAGTDASYFGGNRRNTVGLAEKTCQLCGERKNKGLSSHHVIGKGNDPENLHLEALCVGCHQIVTTVSRRTFVGDVEAWKRLIRYAVLRKAGAWGTVHVELSITFEPDPGTEAIQIANVKEAA